MHKSTRGTEFWEKEKDRVVDMYINQHMRTGEIAKLYGCWPTTVADHLKEWGYELNKERHNAIYNVNSHFFSSIDTEEKAYFLGLILADGHLSKGGVLMLTMKDRDIIERYKKALESEAPVRVDRYGNFFLNIRSKQIAEDLRKIGIHNRKSYEIDLRNILSSVPDNLVHHFVRGMFDGDGSIRIYKYDYVKNPQYHFGYTGLLEVVDFVKHYLGIETKTVKESELTYTCVSSCKETIKRIFNCLYKDATVYIDRKYKTFLEIV